MLSTSSSLPSPDVYLNHFTPSQAARWEFDRNIYLAILGAAIWDFLIYIPDDIKILRRNTGVVSSCSVLSRIFILVFLILSVLMYTHPLANCQVVDLIAAIFNGLGVACFSILFVQRIHALYYNIRTVQWAFACMWLILVGAQVAVPFGLHGNHRRNTNYCVTDDKKDFILGNKFTPLIFDSLVFLAVSYKVAISTYLGHGPRFTWNTVISGKAIPHFSRAVLQGGQQYYLLMVIANLANVIVLYIPEASAYRAMFTPLCTALGASMACRVYRNIMLFEYKDKDTTLPVPSTINFARNIIPAQTSDCGEFHSNTVGSDRGLAGVGTEDGFVSDKHNKSEGVGLP